MKPLIRIGSFRVWPSQLVLAVVLAGAALAVQSLAGLPGSITVGTYLLAFAGAAKVEDGVRTRQLAAARPRRRVRTR